MPKQINIDIPAIYIPSYNDERPYQIWYGSRGSAKSWTKALYFLLDLRSKPYCRIIFARDTNRNVRKSQFQLFKDIAKRFGLFDEYEWNNTELKITHKRSGNFAIGGSFEKPDSIRSQPDPTDFWAEEPITREFAIDREDFLDIVGSLRNPNKVPPRFHFTFNPIGKENFIYEDFFHPEKKVYDETKANIVRSTYLDNIFCPKETIDFLESLRLTNPARYEVDGLGNWGVAENKSPWFYAFDERFVTREPLKWTAQLPVYLAFDFNINPMTCVVSQLVPGQFIRVIKAYKIHDCTIKELCTRIKSDFYGAVFRVTADPAGGARSAGYESVDTTMHSIIRRELGISLNQMDKPLLNFNRKDAYTELRVFCNTVLQNHPGLLIDGINAKDLIQDIKLAQTIENTDKLFKTSGNSEYGMHLTDGFIYMLTTWLNSWAKRAF